MTEQQREDLRNEISERLLGIYQTVRPDITREMVDAALRYDPTDEAEEGEIDELRVLDSSLDDRELHLAHALEDALRRIANETFGHCIDCGEPIRYERLRAVPWTLRCEADEERVESPPAS
jgi:RNA polymerase-binding transcription factor DksA